LPRIDANASLETKGDEKPTRKTTIKRECQACGKAGIPARDWTSHLASVPHQLASSSSSHDGAAPLGQPPFAIPQSNIGYQIMIK
jgi:hypothetical protein